MRLGVLAFPLRLSSHLFRSGGRINLPLLSIIIGFGVLQSILVIGAALIDGSWQLSGHGKGLFQHYGAWAILIADPLLLIATGYAYYRFRLALATLPVCPGPDKARKFFLLCKPFLRLARADGRGIYFYGLSVVVGFLSWLNNVRQTIDPLPFYGHDVFDAAAHFNGFIVYKFCLFVSWVIVYPIAGFELISISASTWLILARSTRRHLICPKVTHPDNCYGLKNVGTLNVSLLAPYLLVYAVMFSIMMTHETLYGSILIPLALFTILFLAMSYVVIMPSYSLLRKVKNGIYNDLVHRSSISPPRGGPDILQFAVDRLCYANADASPYSSGTKLLLTMMRLVPIVTFLFKFLQQARALY